MPQNTDLPQNIVLQQNGFDRSRQIGPKTLLIQSTLFGPNPFVKNDRCENYMKKHDEKKQGTARSVNNRNHVKERKVKPKEMTNTAGNT